MAMVKVFQKYVKLQGQGHEVKNGTMWKVLSQQKHVQYECPISPGKKVMAKIKVFQTEVKLQGQGN